MVVREGSSKKVTLEQRCQQRRHRDKGIGFQAERRAHNYNNDNTEIVERM